MAKQLLDQYLRNPLMYFLNYTHTQNYTLPKYMQTHNNECVDILSDYPVHCLPDNTNQISAHSVL